MGKIEWKPGNMLYPLPAVLVTSHRGDEDNVFTVAWAGTICTNPPMLSISVRPERYSYELIKESGEFVINLTTEELAYATDYCGVRSGRDVNKFEVLKLKTEKGSKVDCLMLSDSPVNIECKLVKIEEFCEGSSHHMFMAEVLAVHVDDRYMQGQKFNLSDSKPIVYSHGEYYGLGELLGTFGYSVKKVSKPGRK